MNARSRPRGLGPRAVVVAVVLLAAAVSDAPDAQRHGMGCASFAPNPEHPFFAANDTFSDPDPIFWEQASPADVGLDAAGLERAAADAALSQDIASLLVVRDGKLAFERYFNGSDASRANNVHSLSKSLLSAVTGIAISDGRLELDSEVGDVLPADLTGAHGGLTVEHLLTMSGGLELRENEADYDWAPGDEPGEPSFVRSVLDRPSVALQGTAFAYSTGLTQVLAAVITEATDQSLCAYASERLLAPLGIDAENWGVEPGGYFAGGHSVFLTPREVARFGQLVLQRGAWQGEQLVPAAWLANSLAERWDLRCLPAVRARQGYGYLWWRYDVGGHLVWNASGFGGQDLLIVDDLDLLVVLTHDTSPQTHGEIVGALALLRDFVLPAVTDASSRRPASTCDQQLHAYTMRPDGTERAPVAGWPAGASAWSWSPAGGRLAVVANLDLNFEIYTMSPDGSAMRRLTRVFTPDVMPTWSPDGESIAFFRGEPAAGDLYRMNADGSGVTQLTDFDGYEHSPTWSPDGTSIAFVRGHDDTRGFGERGELWVIRSDGSDPRLLLDDRIGGPRWSPDGDRIALELRGDDTHIAILSLADGRVADLGSGFAPAWSPDGSRLVFASGRDGDTDIFVIDSDGTDIVQLTDDAAFDTAPIWSPDGHTLLFLSRTS